LLGFEWKTDFGIPHLDAYEEDANSVEDLIEACRNVARKLSLKKARTSVIDTMMKVMRLVPKLIGDWQESSACGAAATALAMCKAHFPAMNFASVADGVPKATNTKHLLAETRRFVTLFANQVDHSSRYEKHDLPAGFADEEEEGGEGGSDSSAHTCKELGDGSGKDNTYQASNEDKAESSK
jgi:hypothetical protein